MYIYCIYVFSVSEGKYVIFDLCECEAVLYTIQLQYTGKIIVIDKCCKRSGGPIDQFFQLHNINVFLEKNMFTNTNTVNINKTCIDIFFSAFLE